MGRVRQVSLYPRRTKRVFECLYYHGKDLCVGYREMVCSTLSHLRGHRNMPWERRSADTIYTMHNSEGLTPIAPTRQSDQGEPHGVGGTPGLNVAFLREGKLCAQKEVFWPGEHGSVHRAPGNVHRRPAGSA